MNKFSKLTATLVFIIVTGGVSLWHLGLVDGEKIVKGFKNLSIFFGELFPPQWEIMPTLIQAILETIQISYTGTILGFLMSLPLAFLSSSLFFPRIVYSTMRMIVGGIRTIPSILFGIIFVIAVGLGPAAGTLGVAFYTVGYLAKIYYEAFEAVDREVIEAVRSTGCNRVQLFRFAILPETANTIISQVLFMFEYNIRASTIMGFVGAGGIGFYMVNYVQMLEYKNLLTTLILTFVVVIAIDFLSSKIRAIVAPPYVRQR